VSIWRTLISTRDIFSQHKTTAFRHTLNWNYIYCFPYNISLKDGIYRCPTTLFRLSSNVGFKTTDRDYHPVIRKVHIVSNNEKAYIEDVHIGHFNDSSIAQTGIAMFDRIQELLNQLDDKEQEVSRSWSVEKYSGSFWFLIGLGSVLTIFSLLFMVSNQLLTHHGANKTKRTIRSHVQQVLSEVKDLRQVYDSVSDMKPKTALKAVLQSNLTAKSETNNSTSNHNHNTVNRTKPTVHVGEDHTFHIQGGPKLPGTKVFRGSKRSMVCIFVINQPIYIDRLSDNYQRYPYKNHKTTGTEKGLRPPGHVSESQ